MADPIREVRAPSAAIELPTPAGKPDSTSPDFSSLFADAVAKVNQFQNESQQRVDRLLRGEDEELHSVLLESQRAELSFEMFLQVRNKVVQAYQEVMRMQM